MIDQNIIDECICFIRADTPYTSLIISRLLHPDRRIYSISGYFKMFVGSGIEVFSRN